MSVMIKLEGRERVKRLIIDPLTGRGEPPRGFSASALADDYLDALGSYPEEVLAKAAAIVRRTWERNTWPLPGVYRKVAEEMMAKEPTAIAKLGSKAGAGVEAWQYVHRRLKADGALMTRAINAFAIDVFRSWLFDQVRPQILSGSEPQVSQADCEEWLTRWEQDHPLPTSGNLAGNLGAVAQRMVDRAAQVQQGAVEREIEL